MKKKIIGIVIFCILAFSLICYPTHYDKVPIHEATYQQIEQLDDIGYILTPRIQKFLKDNPNCEINDIIKVKGIGPERVKTIKQKFR